MSALGPVGDGPHLASLSDDGARTVAGKPLSALAVDLEALTLARRPRLRDALAARLVDHLSDVPPANVATESD